MIERTLSIIKPDAVAKNVIGAVYQRFENADLRIVAAKMLHLDKDMAEGFYAVHQEKAFFASLVTFMTSGPIMLQVLEGENAVVKNRKIMGATNPEKADAGTIRADFATNVEKNAVHGSDSLENAKIEIDYFFNPSDILPRIY